MSWWDELQQASLNGVPFGVLGDEGRFGRRVAVHEYPMKDKPWVEDLGRATRRINLTGFLIENSLAYGGGDVLAQRDALVAAAETEGTATLVHPTLGRLSVTVPEDGLTVAERWDAGRYMEIRLSVIESGRRVFPSSGVAGNSLLASLASALGLSAAQDFVDTVMRDVNLGLGVVHGVLSLGQSVVSAVVAVVADVNVIAGQISRDATSLFNLGSLLTGDYGRYVNANVTSAFVPAKVNSGLPWTMPALTAAAAEGRQDVQIAADALTLAANDLDASTVTAFPNAVQGLMTATAGVIGNPGDAINRFQALASYQAPTVPGTGQVSQAAQIAADATAALVRRMALGVIGASAADYAPSSYNDAATVRTQVDVSIDAEVLVAGDDGDDASYSALRALRQGVVASLATVGATLAPLRLVTLGNPWPALAAAQMLYQDASRSDQLIVQADPIHPAFMPVRFEALAS